MVYAQLYHKGGTGELIPACGSDAVVRLDGRCSRTSWDRVVNDHVYRLRNVKPLGTYRAYKLMKGETYTRAAPISELITITKPTNHDLH